MKYIDITGRKKKVQEFIDENKDKTVKLEVTSWEECGERAGDDTRPVFKMEISPLNPDK